VVALGAGRNVETLAQQIARHQPELVSLDTEQSGSELKAELGKLNLPLPRLVYGEEGLVESPDMQRRTA
jgi:1-deoxy-D-xylulose 5-phosphate reductoisomerase